jgi:O-antigen/teichoic acid export membrane protein
MLPRRPEIEPLEGSGLEQWVLLNVTEDSSAEGLLRSALAVLLLQLLGLLAKYGLEISYARIGGPQGYGVFSVALTMAHLIAMLGGAGLASTAIKILPPLQPTETGPAVRRLRRLQMGCLTGTSILGVVIVLLVSPGAFQPWGVSFMIAPIVGALAMNREIARATGRAPLGVGTSLVLQPMAAMILAVAIWYKFDVLAATNLVVIYGVAATLVVAVQRLALRGRSMARTSQRYTRDPISTPPSYSILFRLGRHLLLLTSSAWVLSQIDIVLLASLAGEREAGLYAAAVRISLVVTALQTAINVVASPRFSALYALQDMSGLRRTMATAINWTFWPSVIPALLFLWLPGLFLGFFGPAFTVASGPLRILVAGQLVNAAVGPVQYLLSFTGHARATGQMMAVLACVGTVLNFVFIPLWGMMGAAIATSITLVMWNVALGIMCKRRLNIIPLPILCRGV